MINRRLKAFSFFRKRPNWKGRKRKGKHMIHEQIEIKVNQSKESAKLYTYFLDNIKETGVNRNRPVILICPGGGYERTSDREAESIAIQFLSAGFHAVVLRYSVYPVLYPEALLQLAKTIAFLRSNAEKYCIDINRIIVQGFSAGGHLAASIGVFWKKEKMLANTLGMEAEQFRPNGLILSYPVITSGPKLHSGSFLHLLGDDTGELKEKMSLEHQVDSDTPPTFLWHTATDDAVPVENSLLFFESLHKYQIPVEMHIYPIGGHGLALATEETCMENGYGIQEECQSWMGLAISWVKHLK